MADRRRYFRGHEDHRDPDRAPERAARSAVPGGVGSCSADDVPGHDRPDRDGRGRRRDRIGRHDGRVRGVRAPVRRPGSAGDRPPRPGRSRRSTSTPGATGRSRSRSGTSPGRSPASRSRRCSAARSTGSRPTPRAGSLLPRRRRGPSAALRLREEGFRALKIRVDPRTPKRLEEGIAAVDRDAPPGRRHDGDHGRPQPGLADGRRRDARRSTSRPPDRSPSGSPSSTCSGSRSRSTAPTWPVSPSLRAAVPGIRIAGGEMTRTYRELEAAVEADAFDVHQPDVVLAAGMSNGRRLAELALAKGRWYSPHTWTNGHRAAGQPARRGRRRRRAVHRVPVRPAGLDPGAARRLPRRADPAALGRDAVRADDARDRGRPRRGRDPAVRGMSGTAERARVSAEEWIARAAAVDAADRGVHRRAVRARGIGRDLRRHRRPRRVDDRRGRVGRRRGRRPGGRARRARRSTTGAGPTARRPTASGSSSASPSGSASSARSWPCSSRSTSASRSATRSRSTSRRAAKTIQWYAETIDKVYGEVGPTGPDALSAS